MRVPLLLLAAASLATAFVSVAPAADACAYTPPDDLDCLPPCLPTDCELTNTRFAHWIADCETNDPVCDATSGWLVVVSTFAASGWLDVPHVTCAADQGEVLTLDGSGACQVVVRAHMPDGCAVLTLSAKAVGPKSGVTRESSVGVTGDIC